LLERRLRWLTGAFAGCVTVAALAGLSGCASPASAPRPAPTTTDYTQYDALYADWAPKYLECARSHGADARLTTDGSIVNATAPGRPTQDGLDADCLKTVGPPPDPPPLTTSYLRGLYRLYVVQAACLTAHGYVISTPPSEDEWVENYSGKSWNPLMDVDTAGRQLGPAEGMCPQPSPRQAEQAGTTPRPTP
jgi:hypothetical protein